MSGRGPRTALLPGLEVSPRVLFLGGALLFPPFLLQQDIVVRGGLILLFMVLNALAGRRVRVGQTVFVAAGIVLFNLVIPTGRVLAAPLGLPITEAALKSGLMKATAMTGLIFLSQFSVRSTLRLPGRMGGLIGRSLYYFEAIMSERARIDRHDIIGSLDSILLSMQAPSAVKPSVGEPVAGSSRNWSRAGGPVVLGAIVAVNWLLFLVTLVHPHPLWGG
jgi:hypothetical protein